MEKLPKGLVDNDNSYITVNQPNALTQADIKKQKFHDWIEQEQKKGGVDHISLETLRDIENSEQALAYIKKLAELLQTKLPYNDEVYINEKFVLDNDVEDIIGKNRDQAKSIVVSCLGDQEYSGNIEQQKQRAAEADVNIVSLSPAENLTRLMQIADKIWDALSDKEMNDEEKKNAVLDYFSTIEYGYARNFQGKVVNDRVLSSGIRVNGQVGVGDCFAGYEIDSSVIAVLQDF
ncbi:MAG: hypothetical protein LBM09_02345 [Candidatus Nomurabacteria bacterium]|jgi:hypothetical protein|nr:hypothetical protein [Candidatus Nomurabacteria bacterium]